jgi:hypothetical protein
MGAQELDHRVEEIIRERDRAVAPRAPGSVAIRMRW